MATSGRADGKVSIEGITPALFSGMDHACQDMLRRCARDLSVLSHAGRAKVVAALSVMIAWPDDSPDAADWKESVGW